MYDGDLDELIDFCFDNFLFYVAVLYIYEITLLMRSFQRWNQ
jgi:hypothetical protein